MHTWGNDAVVNAFGEVKDAFSVFLYNWTRITELRSIHKRLMEFETAINYDRKSLRKPRKSDVEPDGALSKTFDVLFPVFFIIGVRLLSWCKRSKFDTKLF